MGYQLGITRNILACIGVLSKSQPPQRTAFRIRHHRAFVSRHENNHNCRAWIKAIVHNLKSPQRQVLEEGNDCNGGHTREQVLVL